MIESVGGMCSLSHSLAQTGRMDMQRRPSEPRVPRRDLWYIGAGWGEVQSELGKGSSWRQ